MFYQKWFCLNSWFFVGHNRVRSLRSLMWKRSLQVGKLKYILWNTPRGFVKSIKCQQIWNYSKTCKCDHLYNKTTWKNRPHFDSTEFSFLCEFSKSDHQSDQTTFVLSRTLSHLTGFTVIDLYTSYSPVPKVFQILWCYRTRSKLRIILLHWSCMQLYASFN